jgi:hypothetical protein
MDFRDYINNYLNKVKSQSSPTREDLVNNVTMMGEAKAIGKGAKVFKNYAPGIAKMALNIPSRFGIQSPGRLTPLLEKHARNALGGFTKIK